MRVNSEPPAKVCAWCLGSLVTLLSTVRNTDKVGPGQTCLELGVDSDLVAFPLVPTVPFWLSHGQAGDITCAR